VGGGKEEKGRERGRDEEVESGKAKIRGIPS